VAFWSGEKLLKEVPLRGIVDPYDPAKIDCSAFTLTLGPEFFVSPDYATPSRESVKKLLAAPSTVSLGGGQRQLAGGELVIPSGQFALLLTEEFVRIPHDVMGFISLKFGVKGPGLINVSGFHVDPGYEGRLIFSVYNAGPKPAHLNRGQDVFLLWLADLDQHSTGRFVKSPPANPMVSIPIEMISRADAPIHSLQQLSEQIESLHRQLNLFKGLGAVLVAIASIIGAMTYFAPAGPPPSAPTPIIISPSGDVRPQLQLTPPVDRVPKEESVENRS
jgi:dCTP deaminase